MNDPSHQQAEGNTGIICWSSINHMDKWHWMGLKEWWNTVAWGCWNTYNSGRGKGEFRNILLISLTLWIFNKMAIVCRWLFPDELTFSILECSVQHKLKFAVSTRTQHWGGAGSLKYFVLEDKGLIFLYGHFCSCWCPIEERSQGNNGQVIMTQFALNIPVPTQDGFRREIVIIRNWWIIKYT